MYGESIMEAFINHKKQINATVLLGLMNSGWRGIQILKTTRFSPRSSNELTKGGRENDAKESYQPPSLISPEKHHWGKGSLLLLLSQKVWNNYKPRIRGRAFLEAPFFQLVPFSAPALIFEPIKLRQEWALLSSLFRGEKRQQSLGKYWNRRITSNPDQTCLMPWRPRISHWRNPISQTKWAWCDFFTSQIATEQQTCSTSSSPHTETDTGRETSAHCSS